MTENIKIVAFSNSEYSDANIVCLFKGVTIHCQLIEDRTHLDNATKYKAMTGYSTSTAPIPTVPPFESMLTLPPPSNSKEVST